LEGNSVNFRERIMAMKEYKVLFKRTKPILIYTSLALFFVTMTIPLHVIHAQQRVKPEWRMPKHYPNGFNGWGHINVISVDTGEVVIEDVSLRLSPHAEYHTPTETNVPITLLQPGNLVGFIKNSQDEIISLWLIVME
jgi:hypothetical protein